MQLAASSLPVFKGSLRSVMMYSDKYPDWAYRGHSRWPEVLSHHALEYGLSLCDGQWNGGSTPISAEDRLVADDALVRDAFGHSRSDEPPADEPPREHDAGEEDDAPGFQQILFIDVLGSRPK